MKFNLFRKSDNMFTGTIEILNKKDRYLYPDIKLYRKIRRLSKKYHTYDIDLTNTNEILLKIGHFYPFKLRRKFDYGYLFIPTKVSYFVKTYNINVKLYIDKEK